MTDKLNTRQRLFVEAYLANPNATEAALKAGYSEKTAYSQGQRLLKKVEIAAAVEKRVENAIVTADEVLKNVKIIAQSAERDGDKLKGWELLGKYLKMWTDKSEVDHSGEVNVNHSGEIAFQQAAAKVYGDETGDNNEG